MPYRDLRHYLDCLEEKRLLCWIETEVDPAWEVSSICRSVLHGLPEGKRVALGFRRVKGFPGSALVVGAVGISRQHIAAAMEVASEESLLQTMTARLAGSPEETAKKGRGGLSGRVIIDATYKWRYPESALPPREMLKRVGQRWQDYGLPELGEMWFPCEWK